MNFSEAQSFLTKQQEWIQVIFSIFWLKMDHLKQPPIETWTIMSWACLLRCCGRCRLAHSLTIKYLLAASCIFTDGSNYPKHHLNLAVLNQLLVSSVGSKHLESIKHCNKLNLGQTYWPMTIQLLSMKFFSFALLKIGCNYWCCEILDDILVQHTWNVSKRHIKVVGSSSTQRKSLARWKPKKEIR